MKTKISISYELLSLLKWIVLHAEDDLKHIINKALDHGLTKELSTPYEVRELSFDNQELQDSMLDFFGLSEALLIDLLQEHQYKKATNKSRGAIDNIDPSICDTRVVESSIEHATQTVEQHPDENMQENIYKEILRQWHPSGKMIIN